MNSQGGKMESSQKDLFEFKLDLLKKELDLISSVIGRYDSILFQIKGWAITLWIAVVGFGLQGRLITVFILAFFIPVLFCFIELEFKRIQRQYIFRGNKLEKFLRNDDQLTKAFEERKIPENPGVWDPNAHDIGKLSETKKEYEKKISRWTILRFPNVYLFYMIIITLTIVALLCVIMCIEKPGI